MQKTAHKITLKEGYVIISCPEHPNANKGNGNYIFEHRLVMEKHHGRLLTSEEHVHHTNGDRGDNRIENLELTTNTEHRKIHWEETPISVRQSRMKKANSASAKLKKKPRVLVMCSCGCGESFITPDSKGREHKYLHGHNARGKHWTVTK